MPISGRVIEALWVHSLSGTYVQVVGFGKKLARFEASTVDEGSVAPRARSIEALREEMARILRKEDTREARRAQNLELGLADLPFVVEETEHGRLVRRTRAIRDWESVGVVPIAGFSAAKSDRLAALALDDSIASVDLSRALFLDTETTGLSGGTGTVAFLLGLAFIEEGTVVVEQLLLPNFGEEGPMLNHLRRRMEASSVVFSFNGKSFDWPLLRTRFVMNRTPTPSELPHCDLLHVARRIHKERLEDTRLQTIEREVLGLTRVGDIESALIGSIFGHFLRTGDGDGVRRVVEHNEQDVLSMVALAAVYGSTAPASEEGSVLDSTDFLGIANTLRRAKKLDEAETLASEVIASRPSAAAHRTRAAIAKAKKNIDLAIEDYQASAKVSPSEQTHLELAKLYEHKLKDPERALVWTLEGTGEDAHRLEKRTQRLQQKQRLKQEDGRSGRLSTRKPKAKIE